MQIHSKNNSEIKKRGDLWGKKALFPRPFAKVAGLEAGHFKRSPGMPRHTPPCWIPHRLLTTRPPASTRSFGDAV